MKDFIRKISYYAPVIRLVRFLRLKPLARKMYYWYAGPKGGILDVEIEGVKARYLVNDSDELRLAESVSGDWGERGVLSQLLKKIQPGDCLLDVGANVGMYAILFAKATNGGQVIAFEPEQESCAKLQENITLNGIKNITIFQKALGVHPGTGKLQVGGIAGNFSLLGTEDGVGQQAVQIVNGDEFFKENRLPVPKLVKIDVEGYEYSVIQGLKNILSDKQCRVVCCEMHPDFLPKDVSEGMVLELLQALGFSRVDYVRKPFFKPYHIIAQKP